MHRLQENELASLGIFFYRPNDITIFDIILENVRLAVCSLSNPNYKSPINSHCEASITMSMPQQDTPSSLL
jgi:hypothetical protein